MNAVLNYVPAKMYPFCDVVVFVVDRSLLMGAITAEGL
jgi:hypothetical protein